MGGELGSYTKDDGDVAIHYAFCFPDVYEVGMSHLGLRILYEVINRREDCFCERCFAPWSDMEEQLVEHDLPLYGLETYRPLNEFDIVGFTMQYEMSCTNVLNMLKLGKIPLHSSERKDEAPIVMAGGPCTFNIEPMAPFFDVVVLGEAEDSINEILDCYHSGKDEGLSRQAIIERMATIEGVYVPSYFDVTYEGDTFTGIVPQEGQKLPVKRVMQDMNRAPWPKNPMVPYLGVVHDRVTLELFRGCTRGCRFCQAGMIYRPVREKSVETLVDQAMSNIDATGYDELSLSSLSSGDYTHLRELIKELIEKTGDCPTSLSLPSLRIDAYAKDYMQGVDKQRKAGLTLAPEAGSQRLRDVINKNVTAEDLRNSVSDAFKNGWDTVKLYFMIGLPTETMEDIDGIVDLAQMVSDEYYKLPKELRKRKVRITVSTSSFVPKPHTPFQWVAQDTIEMLKEKQNYLRERLRKVRGVTYNYHDAKLSRLEAIFARGDRKLAPVLEKAVELGCRFDGWTERFDYDKWVTALEACGVDPDHYTGQWDLEAPLPWEHLSSGLNKKFLLREYDKAMKAETTPDCRQNCLGCGVNQRVTGDHLCG